MGDKNEQRPGNDFKGGFKIKTIILVDQIDKRAIKTLIDEKRVLEQYSYRVTLT